MVVKQIVHSPEINYLDWTILHTFLFEQLLKNNTVGGNAPKQILVLRAFKELGGMGVCGNHSKWLQLRPCKIWCRSLRKKHLFRVFCFFEI